MKLIRLAEAGDTAGVLGELAALTPAQRAAHAGALAARAEAMAAAPDEYTDEQRTAQRLAELGCQASPEDAADWLLRNDPRYPTYRPYPGYHRLAEVANLYPPDWRAELVARLALAGPGWWAWFLLAERIIRDTGGPVPTTDTFIGLWLAERRNPTSGELPAPELGATMLERLRNDDLTPKLLPLAVARPGVSLDMSSFHYLREAMGLPRMMEISQVGAFISLAAEGAVDRDALVRRIFADLISAGPRLEDAADVLAALALTPAEHAAMTDDRVQLVERLLKHARSNFMGRETGATIALLRALAPTAAENARFTKEHLALLEVSSYSSSAAVIAYAQEALLGADRAGLLDAEAFTEVSDRVRNRPALGTTDYRVAGFVSRLSAGTAIDRGALIRRIFAELITIAPPPEDAAHVLAALALTPAEHAGVTDDLLRLVEPELAVLLQEDGRKAIAASLAFLSALAPTPAENARFTREYVALLDRPSTVAGHAREALIGADAAGLLDAETFTELCERVLLRPEKKLVRAQLADLDRAARRDPARAARLVVDAATAFQHPDPALQERALDVIARHLPAAGAAVLPELRAAAEWLSPAFAARAVELFGAAQETAAGGFSEVLPAVPEPRPVPGPAATAAEVAQEVAAVVAGDQDVAAFERALDGLVRHARGDRAALARALKPATRRKPAEDYDCRPADLYDVAMAVRDEKPREFAFHVDAVRAGHFSRAGAMLAARMSEAIDIIESGPQPFLVAVPTLATGALDAGVLVERLASLEEAGVEPAPVDLAQALLRVAPGAAADVARAAGELRSAAGQRLARWLGDGGLPHQDSEPKDWYRSSSSWEPARPGTVLDPWFPAVAAALVGPFGREGMLIEPPAPFWVAQLPHHRDETMARDYTRDIHSNWRRRTRVLPFVAEADGPAGYAVHLALARGLAHGTQVDDATVDALLVLAARGQLNAGLLGRQLETLLRAGMLHANRVAASLRAAAETGAYGTVWAVVEAALPGLLRETPHRDAAVFLSLALECVSRCGAKGEIAEVVAVAGRGGSSQTAKNARLLRDALR